MRDINAALNAMRTAPPAGAQTTSAPVSSKDKRLQQIASMMGAPALKQPVKPTIPLSTTPKNKPGIVDTVKGWFDDDKSTPSFGETVKGWVTRPEEDTSRQKYTNTQTGETMWIGFTPSQQREYDALLTQLAEAQKYLGYDTTLDGNGATAEVDRIIGELEAMREAAGLPAMDFTSGERAGNVVGSFFHRDVAAPTLQIAGMATQAFVNNTEGRWGVSNDVLAQMPPGRKEDWDALMREQDALIAGRAYITTVEGDDARKADQATLDRKIELWAEGYSLKQINTIIANEASTTAETPAAPVEAQHSTEGYGDTLKIYQALSDPNLSADERAAYWEELGIESKADETRWLNDAGRNLNFMDEQTAAPPAESESPAAPAEDPAKAIWSEYQAAREKVAGNEEELNALRAFYAPTFEAMGIDIDTGLPAEMSMPASPIKDDVAFYRQVIDENYALYQSASGGEAGEYKYAMMEAARTLRDEYGVDLKSIGIDPNTLMPAPTGYQAMSMDELNRQLEAELVYAEMWATDDETLSAQHEANAREIEAEIARRRAGNPKPPQPERGVYGENVRDGLTTAAAREERRRPESALRRQMERELRYAEQWAVDDPALSEQHAANARRIEDELARMNAPADKPLYAGTEVTDVGAESGAGLYESSDEHYELGTGMYAEATYGLSDLEKLMVDAVQGGLGVAMDAAVSAVTFGLGGKATMALRVFGTEAAESRRNGDDFDTQMLKGLSGAMVELGTEMIGGPFSRVYGRSAMSRITAKSFKNPAVKLILDSAGEGAEEGFAAVANLIIAHMAGWDDGSGTFWEDLGEQGDEILYEMLVAAIIGGFGSTTDQIADGFKLDAANKALVEYIEANIPGGVAAVVKTGVDSEKGTKANTLGLKNQGRLDTGKTLKPGQVAAQYDANIEAMTASMTASMEEDAKTRLKELGETGDWAELGRIIAKDASGQKLTRGETKTLEKSDFGKTVRQEFADADRAFAAETTRGDAGRAFAPEQRIPRRGVDAYLDMVDRKADMDDAAMFEREMLANRLAAAGMGRPTTPLTAKELPGTQQRTLPRASAQTPAAGQPTAQAPQNVGDGGGAVTVGVKSAGGGGIRVSPKVAGLMTAGQNKEAFDAAATRAYRAGLFGTDMGRVEVGDNLTEEQRKAAYELGAQERRAKTERNKGKAGEGAKAKGKGGVQGYNVSLKELRKSFNDAQNQAYRSLDRISRATGLKIMLYDSSKVEGKLAESDGMFEWDGDTLYIDVAAGFNPKKHTAKELSHYTMNRAFGHEFGHFMEKWDAEGYEKLRAYVFDYLASKGVDVDALIDKAMAMYKLDEEAASREVMANGLADILPQSDFIERLYNQDRTLWEKIVDELKKFVANLKAQFAQMDADSRTKAFTEDGVNYAEDLLKMWTDVAETAVKNYQAAETMKSEGETENLVQQSVKRTREMPLNKQLSAIISGELKTSDALYFGDIDLTEIGYEKRPLAMTQTDFWKSYSEKHNTPRRAFKALVDNLLNEKILSFSADGRIGVLVNDVDGDGKPLLIAIAESEMDREPVNVVNSMYGVEKDWVNTQVELGRTLKIYDKEKATSFLQTNGYKAEVGENGDYVLIKSQPDPEVNSEFTQYSLKGSAKADKVNQSMTMQRAADMVQRAFNLADIRDWFDGEYKTGLEWLKGEGAESVALVIENDYNMQLKYLNNIPEYLNEEIYLEDILEAYAAGTLTGKDAKPKTKRLDTKQSTGYADSRFYAPKQYSAEEAAALFETASQKVTKKNREEVNKARAALLFLAHDNDVSSLLGISKAEFNKKLRTWSAYSKTAMDISQRINSGVPVENRWTGIQNCSIINKQTVSDADILEMVKEIRGKSEEHQRQYIARTMLALDTHIDWSRLSFAFKPGRLSGNARGMYADEIITIGGNGYANTVAHEMGHALDDIWGRDILGSRQHITESSRSPESISDPDIRQFFVNFRAFLDSITDAADIRSDYTQRNTEVFARFVAKFVEFADQTAGNTFYQESSFYSDRFTSSHYIEFARLLQEKAMLDGKRVQQAKGDVEGQVQYSRKGDVEADEDYVSYNRRALISGQTLNKWLFDYAANNPDYAQAYIAYMNPRDYLKLTTGGIAERQSIRSQSEGLEVEEALEYSKDQPIQLRFDSETGQIYGHEGRHRMVALENNGIEQVPVLLFDYNNKYSKKPIDSMYLHGQFDATAITGISDVQPFSRGNRDAVVEKFGTKTKHEQMGERYLGKETAQFSRKEPRMSDLEVLEKAANELPKNSMSEEEQKALDEFKRRLDKLRELQQQRTELGKLYKEQMFTKGGNRAEAEKTHKRMGILDQKIKAAENALLGMKNRETIKAVLKKGRKVVEAEQKARDDAKLQAFRANRDESDKRRKYKQRVEEAAREMMDWLTKPDSKDARKRVPLELQNALMELLKSIDFSSAQLLRGKGPTQKDLALWKKLEAVQNAVKANIEAVGAESGMADMRPEFKEAYEALMKKVLELSASGEGYVLNRMSGEELKELSKLLKELKHYVVTANAFVNNATFSHVGEAGRSSISHMKGLGRGKSKGIGGAIGRFFSWNNMRPAYVFPRFGKGGESIYEEFREGQSKQARLAKYVQNFAEATFTPEQAKKWASTYETFEIDGERINIPITHLMSLYCLNKRPQAITHLLRGGIRVAKSKGVAEADTDSVVGGLHIGKMVEALNKHPEAKAVADKLQLFMSTECAKWGNEVDMARFGVPKFVEKNYFPINTDGRYLAATADEAPAQASLYALLNAPFTKAVNEKADQRLILYNIFDVFANHAASMIQYRAYALPTLDALKWFNYTDEDGMSVREAMALAFGSGDESGTGSGQKSYAESFVINLIRSYNGTNGKGDIYESLGQSLMGNFNRAQVAFNLRTIIQQPTSIFRASLVLPYKSIMKGLGMSAVQLKSLAEEMEKYSGIALWKSMGFYDVNISRGLAETFKQEGDWRQKLTETGMKGAELADRYTWAAMWYAAKDSVPRAGKTDEQYFAEVTKVFEEAIYKTQVVDSVLTKAETQRATGFFAKSAMAFMSEPIAALSMLTDAVFKFDLDSRRYGRSGAWQKNKGYMGKVFAAYTVASVLNAAAQAIIDAYRDDDEYEDWWEKYTTALKGNVKDELNPLRKVPLVNDMVSLVVDGYEPTSDWAGWTTYISKGVKAIKDATDGDGKGYTLWGGIYNVMRGVSGALGAPLANISREGVDLWNHVVTPFKPNWKLKTYDPGVAAEIKYAYQDGYISAEEAQKLLVEEGATKAEGGEKAANEAYWTVQGWDGEGKYDDLKEAVIAGDRRAFDQQVTRLTKHGVKESYIYSEARDIIKEQYLEGEMSFSEVQRALINYGDQDEEYAEDQAWRWRFEKETGYEWGGTSYSEGIQEALAKGDISRRQAIDWYAKGCTSTHGSMEEAEKYVRVLEWRSTVDGAEEFNVTGLEKWDDYGFHTTEAGLGAEDFVWAWQQYNEAQAQHDSQGKQLKEKGDVFFESMYEYYRRGVISFKELEALVHSFYSDSYYRKYKFW